MTKDALLAMLTLVTARRRGCTEYSYACFVRQSHKDCQDANCRCRCHIRREK